MFNNVQGALNRRLDAWSSDRDKWKDAMIYLMHNKQHIANTGHFRFFDSGDIQGSDMLDDINLVAWASPHIRFWLPTKEYRLDIVHVIYFLSIIYYYYIYMAPSLL